MRETSLEKRAAVTLKEKGPYALAFGVIAVMLFAVGFPVFILFFFGVLAFFIWKAFSFESRSETRQIFEFYLSTNEIIRDDGRLWYGFEIQEAIGRGEAILKGMSAAPPLVHFGLGVLYQKAGDHSSAVRHLEQVISETASDEMSVVFPTKELREYVRTLRKIERTPREAPLTSSAVRSLERIRKNRGNQMLDLSRAALSGTLAQLPAEVPSIVDADNQSEPETASTYDFADFAKSKKSKMDTAETKQLDRQTISEVLHDIYDKNVQ